MAGIAQRLTATESKEAVQLLLNELVQRRHENLEDLLAQVKWACAHRAGVPFSPQLEKVIREGFCTANITVYGAEWRYMHDDAGNPSDEFEPPDDDDEPTPEVKST